MMTRAEPAPASSESSWDPDLFASLRLDSPRDGVSLLLEFHSRRSLGALLASKLTGLSDAEIDEELLASGVAEVLNVVGPPARTRKLSCLQPPPLHAPSGARSSHADPPSG